MLKPLVEEITLILGREKGESLTYHVGDLAIDRYVKSQVYGPGIQSRTKEERSAINDTAIIAARLAEEGKVALVRHRLGPHAYQYIAQRL